MKSKERRRGETKTRKKKRKIRGEKAATFEDERREAVWMDI